MVSDVLVISDLHLGSDNCQAKSLTQFLEEIRRGKRKTKSLILNGDLFDSMDFRRLNKHHWRVLSLLRKLSDQIEIIWINGNHDGPAEFISHLLGVNVYDEYILESGQKRILFLHGHRFDEFIDNHPFVTAFADWIYRILQKIDQSHSFAKYAKQRSKTFLRCAQKIEADSKEYARKLNCLAICCGHTHHAQTSNQGITNFDQIEYFNSGCWTEKPCHYLAISEGKIELCSYEGIEENNGKLELINETISSKRELFPELELSQTHKEIQ